MRIISLHTCGCEHCKERPAVCVNGFDWMDRGVPDHATDHAKKDLLEFFDRLPPTVRAALTKADVNVCALCTDGWVQRFGATRTVQLIRNAQFVPGSVSVAVTGGIQI